MSRRLLVACVQTRASVNDSPLRVQLSLPVSSFAETTSLPLSCCVNRSLHHLQLTP